MPDPSRLLTTISRAIAANTATAGRRGRLVELSDAIDVLIAGDLHGHVANFHTVYRAADLANHPRRHLVIQEVVHGKFRYPLGGDKSHQLLDLFCALKNQFPNRVHLLMGNHELAQWTGNPIMKGDEDLNALFSAGIAEAYGKHAENIEAAYHGLFATLPLAIRLPSRVLLCHSIPAARHMDQFELSVLETEKPPAEVWQPKGMIYALLWGRDCSAANVEMFLKRVDCDWLVTGHIPCEQGFATPNERQMILDCCTSPAAYALIPADHSLTREEFLAKVHVI
jgi:calcineurin-like phosphoesterase family protein